MIEIDGSHCEGGGQMVRTALALSVLTGKGFLINNIRAGRSDPGLKAQHLQCIEAFKQLCNPEVEGATLGSPTLHFVPRSFCPQNLMLDIGTAGSITLLLQSLLLPCIFGKKTMTIKITGGTENKWAMPWDYFVSVVVPHYRRYAGIECSLLRRGYYPRGGGQVSVKVKPRYPLGENISSWRSGIATTLRPIELLNQGKLLMIHGISNASSDLAARRVAERQASEAERALLPCHVPITIRSDYSPAQSSGSGIVLWATYEHSMSDVFPMILGADGLGGKDTFAEDVGANAGKKLFEKIASKACVDVHLADNLIPLLGLFGGEIRVREITDHVRTNIFVTELFLDTKFEIDENKKIIQAMVN